MPFLRANFVHRVALRTVFPLVLALAASAQDKGPVLELTSPVENQVVQRSSRSEGLLPIVGSWTLPKRPAPAAPTALEARVFREGTPASSSQWVVLPFSPFASFFRGVLKVPSGGWYRLEVRLVAGDVTEAAANVQRVGMGEVFVVAGQSNSANHGEVRQQPKSGLVTSFDGSSWRVSNDPQPGASGEKGSFIPALGDALAERLKVPIGFVCLGVGSTSVREWLPAKVPFLTPPTKPDNVLVDADGRFESTGRLFARLTGRLGQLGPHGVRAVLWHQGESDWNQQAGHRVTADEYAAMLRRVIADSRRSAGWDVPWVVALASYHNPADPGSELFRAAQRSVADDRLTWVGPSTDALPPALREKSGTGVHFSSEGLRQHGLLWADVLAPWIERQTPP